LGSKGIRGKEKRERCMCEELKIGKKSKEVAVKTSEDSREGIVLFLLSQCWL
jgi:hypothetical protein